MNDLTKNIVFHDVERNHPSRSEFGLANVTFEERDTSIAGKKSDQDNQRIDKTSS